MQTILGWLHGMEMDTLQTANNEMEIRSIRLHFLFKLDLHEISGKQQP